MLNKKMSKFYELITEQQHFTIGLSILRIVIGMHIAFTYVVYLFERQNIWGINSFVPKEVRETYLTIFSINDSLIFFEVVYFSGLIINFLFTIGFYSRLTTILNFVFTFSLYNQNPFILDGGNNILIIILFFLMFAKLDHHFSVTQKKSLSKSNAYSNILHNTAVFLCLFQVCILYFFAGLFKAQGDMWIHGTALYYILNVEEFTQPFLANIILQSPILITFSSVSAIFFQLFFPFLILNKYTKFPMLFASICFHLGIIVVMGLIQFGIVMIALDLLFITDKEYLKAYSFIKDRAKKKDIENDSKQAVI